jgi:hypothetical protein
MLLSFENRVLRRIFGPKGDEVTGEWRKLHSGELHNLYSSPDIIKQIKSRRMRWAGHVARMGEGRNMYRVLVGKPERKSPLGRPRRRWEDGIKMDLREIGWGGVEWIQLAQDRDRWRAVVNAVMNLWVLAARSYSITHGVSLLYAVPQLTWQLSYESHSPMLFFIAYLTIVWQLGDILFCEVLIF